MNVVDSSGWMEVFRGGKNAEKFASIIENSEQLIIPSLCFFEVRRGLRRQGLERVLPEAMAAMGQGEVVALDEVLATVASEVALETGLAMADSIILATAKLHKAVLWTQDSDFKGISGIRYIPA